MKKLKLKVNKLVPEAVIPSYAHPGDCCMDLTAVSINTVEEADYAYLEYDTGLSFEFPADHVMLIFPRSSISNTGLLLSNAVGIVEPTFRGSVKFRFKWVRGSRYYMPGDRVGQFMIIPRPGIQIEEVSELSETERDSGGFGSSGK